MKATAKMTTHQKTNALSKKITLPTTTKGNYSGMLRATMWSTPKP